MNTKDRFKNLLRDMFRIESSDLDFGIYRIMNYKRDEINKFIDDDLDNYIEIEIADIYESKISGEKQELLELERQLKKLGVDTNDSEEYMTLRENIEKEEYAETKEIDIYEHIYNFFKRYYDNGDFISQMRYSQDTKYVVPYNGEEIYFHWANKEQYYVKTSEDFVRYIYDYKGIEVEFIVDNAELNKNNVKIEENRYFILKEDFFQYNDEINKVNIYFEYRSLKDNEKKEYNKQNTQRDINKNMIKFINNKIEHDYKEKLGTLLSFDQKTNKGVMENHLHKYTKKNTSDYFIHKDLKGFLEQELDFYIKNEIFDLSTINFNNLDRLKEVVLVIDIFKNICKKIIEFLDDIENLQKKLFEKKKFVIQSDYCFTLDRIPTNKRNEVFSEVLLNSKQLNEWEKLYNETIEKIDDLYYQENNPSKEKKLKYLMIDTKFFNNQFKYMILSFFDEIDEEIDGLLIHSENYQGLDLLKNKYKNKIDCIYIDPPYNAKSSEILYKNTFKHSSWLAFMYDRLNISKKLLKENSVQITAIDENEQEHLGLLLKNIFKDWDKNLISIIHNPAGIQGNNFSYTHEYAYFVFPKNKNIIGQTKRDEDLVSPLRDWGGTSARNLAKNCFYPIMVKNNEIIGFGEVCDENYHPEASHIIKDDVYYIYPIDKHGVERKWVFGRNSVENNIEQLYVEIQNGKPEIIRRKSERSYYTVWDDKKYYANIYGSRLLSNLFGELKFSFPKSIYTVRDSLWATLPVREENSIILDYFAGSGTTGHAVINLNKEHKGKRKYILIEMGDYFSTVLKPRIQKVVFSDEWDSGNAQNYNGYSQMFKYMQLEQYEDTLKNIEFEETKKDKQLEIKEFMDDYLIKYMLNRETQKSILDIDKFKNPFDYKIKLENEENEITNVDLVETFNYLIGLNVSTITKKNNDDRVYVIVTGKTYDENVIVIWRNTINIDMEKDKRYIEKEIINEISYDKVYINCDNYVSNSYLIEEQFHKLMFNE